MTKRIAILAVLVALAVALAGCGIKPPIQWDETEERARVLEAMNGWVDGVEAYNIDAMAGNGILAAGFELIIEEGTNVQPKKADKLRSELNADADNQDEYRKAANGYVLRLDIDNAAGVVGYDDVNAWTIVSINKTNAEVVGKFEVYETAKKLEGITDGHIVDGWWKSDTGNIAITLVRTPNAWKMTNMTIKFDVFGSLAVGAGSSEIAGFAFGNPRRILSW